MNNALLNANQVVTTVASSKAAHNVTRTMPDSVVNTKSLSRLLSNPNAKLGFMDRKIIVHAIHSLNNGNAASRIVRAVGRAIGRVITKAEARKVLETKLNAQTAQQAIKSNENIQKAAIDAGLWNNGINYTVTDSSNTTAPGATGNTQNNTIGGSFLGG